MAKRDWEGKYIEPLIGQGGEEAVRNIVKNLIKAKISQHLSKNQNRVPLSKGNYRIILERASNNTEDPRWLWSGFEMVEEGKYRLVIDGKVYESVGETVDLEPQWATLDCSYSAARNNQGALEGAHVTRCMPQMVIPYGTFLALQPYAHSGLDHTHYVGATDSMEMWRKPEPGTAEYGLTLNL